MRILPRQLITLIVAITFLSLVFFGFALMTHFPGSNMVGDCPLSVVAGSSLCLQDNLGVVMHHISTYQSIFEIPLENSMTAFLSSILLTLLLVIYILFDQFTFYRTELQFVGHNKLIPLLSKKEDKITRWLSLLENSPPK
ncbi:MAG TPA: hypothetical protein VJJ22_04370 [Candidatus Paceibacterota bacterium]